MEIYIGWSLNYFEEYTCTMVYKALNGLAPEYISDVFTKVSESHMRNLRSVDNDLLRVPSSRTSYYENSFTISSVAWLQALSFLAKVK